MTVAWRSSLARRLVPAAVGSIAALASIAKGFAAHTSKPPANGHTWTTGPGNSSNPPSPPLPGYMAVVVSNSISRSGSTISGDTVRC